MGEPACSGIATNPHLHIQAPTPLRKNMESKRLDCGFISHSFYPLISSFFYFRVCRRLWRSVGAL